MAESRRQLPLMWRLYSIPKRQRGCTAFVIHRGRLSVCVCARVCLGRKFVPLMRGRGIVNIGSSFFADGGKSGLNDFGPRFGHATRRALAFFLFFFWWDALARRVITSSGINANGMAILRIPSLIWDRTRFDIWRFGIPLSYSAALV
jgi:hypothetical protein